MELKNVIIVANTGDDSLSFVDPGQGVEMERIHLERGSGPADLLLSKDKSYIYVLQSYDNSLGLFHLENKEIARAVYVGCRPSQMAADHRGRLFIANGDSDSISIVHESCMKPFAQITVGSMPEGIDCHFSLPILAVANVQSHDVWLLEADDFQCIQRIKVEGYPSKVKFSRFYPLLYICCWALEQQCNGVVLIFDLKSYRIVDEIEVGCHPNHMAESEGGLYLLVVAMGNACLDVIDMKQRKVVCQIEAGSLAHDVVLDTKEQYAYVTNSDEDTVSVLDWKKGRKIKDIRVGKEPGGLIYLP